MKKINKLVLSIALVFLCETASAKDFWDRAWDVAQAVGTEVLKNEVNKAYRNDYSSEINQLRSEARSLSYNNDEVKSLLNNISKLNRANNQAQNKITELERMLIQQNDIIINKNQTNRISGSEFIKSFYSLSKAVSLTDSYALLSNNAQQKLPFNDYNNWWNKTVKSVYVDKVTPLGGKKYKVNLSYYKHGGSYQCSEDIIYLLWNNNEWLINDFSWGYCN